MAAFLSTQCFDSIEGIVKSWAVCDVPVMAHDRKRSCCGADAYKNILFIEPHEEVMNDSGSGFLGKKHTFKCVAPDNAKRCHDVQLVFAVDVVQDAVDRVGGAAPYGCFQRLGTDDVAYYYAVH